MSLSLFFGEEETQLNEHEVAWMGKDWDSVKKLADSFKQKEASEFFYILNQINNVNRVRLDTDFLESYNQYSINQSLSKHIDAIYHAYVMNLLGDAVTDQMHFDYLFHAVRPAKRFNEKSVKNPIDEMVDSVFVKVVARFYKVGIERAAEYIEKDFDDYQIQRHKKMLAGSVNESLIKDACSYAKKTEITAVMNAINEWKK